MPDNGGYMVAAYIVTAVVLVGYAVSLFLTSRAERKRISSDD